MRDLAFVCREPGCGYAKAGRKFAGQGLVAHYRGHGKQAEGTRQLNLQRRKLAGEEVDETPLKSNLMLAEAVDPQQQRIPQVRTDLERLLEEAVGKLTVEIQKAEEEFDVIQARLVKLRREMVRVMRAKSGYEETLPNDDQLQVLERDIHNGH